MTETRKPQPPAETIVTTMRLNVKVLKAADKRAAKLDKSRTKYFEMLLRKDLGMEASEYDIFA
jgi:hypothetical protein